jgi:hypothetical protein
MRRYISGGILAVLLVATATAQQGKPINAKCPVKGDPVKAGLTTTYMGQTIGFC